MVYQDVAPSAATVPGLGDAWRRAFRVGAAVSPAVLNHKPAADIIGAHFSSLTAENAMKFGVVQPEENRWAWADADVIADFARTRGIPMRGHTMVWHNQTPEWLFRDGGEPVSAPRLFSRLETHIAALAERYNPVVYAWDVLNEVIDVEKGTDQGLRLSNWYTIGGREIYEFAFKTAREASPNALLFYNDYNIEEGAKLEATIRFLSELLDRGAPVQGLGIQGHWRYNYPDALTLRTAIERYAALGLEIALTEVDISVYGPGEAVEPGDFLAGMPEDRLCAQAERYQEIFRIASEYPAVKNITTWGVADDHTWLDNFPVRDRKNWPLLFDTHCRPKAVVSSLVETGLSLGKH